MVPEDNEQGMQDTWEMWAPKLGNVIIYQLSNPPQLERGLGRGESG